VTSVLELSAIDVARGARTVVQGVSLTVERGESVALIGASGSGKTTVLRAIAGLEPIAAGRIAVDGVALTPGALPHGHARRELYRRVGIVFQFHHLFAHLTAAHNVWLAPVHVRGESRASAERRALELLDQLGVAERAHAMPHELSGGEAQRVAIARALAMRPQVLLMDEPTASLDPARRGELAATLRRLAADGCAVLTASHDEDFVRACAERTITIDAGRVTTANGAGARTG